MEKRAQFSLGYYLVVFMTIFALQSLFFSGSRAKEIPYSDFLARVEAGSVEQVVITEEKIYGLLKEPASRAPSASDAPTSLHEKLALEPPPKQTPWRVDLEEVEDAVNASVPAAEDEKRSLRERFTDMRERAEREQTRHFQVIPLDDPELLSMLRQHEVTYQGRIESKWLQNLFLNWILPIGALVLIWGFLIRRMGAGPNVLNVGKSKAKIYEINPDKLVRFSDVAGVDEAIEEVQEVVNFLKNPEPFLRLGAKLPKGVLLTGPPGTGKTLLAKAVAGESGVPFFSLSGSDFVEMFVGVGAARIRDLFAEAKSKAPCIIFIDEIDAIGRSRGGPGAMMSGNSEQENTLNQLLVEMDGFDAGKEGVVLMGATNRPEVLDRALLRPGRFDREILVDRPHREGRHAILKVHTRDLPLAADVDLENLAGQLTGFVGADLANLCNEAALLATRRSHREISMTDFQDAIERVIGGLEKKGQVLGEAERRKVAYHESGHALVGWFTKGADPVQKISIVPRGRGALGYTMQAPEEDHFLLSRGDLLGRVRVLLGGRAAEQLVFGEVSTGAADDLEKASQILRAMLTVYGMGEQLPNLSLVEPGPAGFLGQERPMAAHSETIARAIGEEHMALLAQCYEDARGAIEKRRDLLDALAERLLDREKLDGRDITEILGERDVEATTGAEA